MAAVCKTTILVSLAFLLTSCCASFYWPDPVCDASDVMNLDPSVTWIRARGLSDNDIHSLSTRTNIERLDFWGGWAVEELRLTDEGLKNLAGIKLPKLDRLELGYCDHISDKGLYYISKMDQIRSLYFVEYNRFSNAGLKHLSNMNELSELIFQGGKSIDDKGLKYLSKIKSLRLLTIQGSKDITDNGLEHISHLGNLESFYLYGDDNKVTNKGLGYLSEMKQLKVLVLPFSPYITDSDIIKLKLALPSCDVRINKHSKGEEKGSLEL